MVYQIFSMRQAHCAVCVDDCVITFGGWGILDAKLSCREIWVYSLYTEEWKKRVIPKGRSVPKPFCGAVSVAVEGNIYTFGGVNSCDFTERNELWKLSRTNRECFTWSFIKYESKKKSPSPRDGHSGWEYAGRLWVFGGEGSSPQDYLNDHGDIAGDRIYEFYNNQLLYFDVNSHMWTNPQCFGAKPLPRSRQSCAIFGENLWLFGGCKSLDKRLTDDFFQLNMHSFTWTQIQNGLPSPQARCLCTLTAVTNSQQLVLHGGWSADRKGLTDTWIMDLASYSWRPYTSRKDHARFNHTATLGLNSSVIIIGGHAFKMPGTTVYWYEKTFHVMLEPKSLQKLSLHTVYKFQADLPWKCLPKKLITVLGISDKAQTSKTSGAWIIEDMST